MARTPVDFTADLADLSKLTAAQLEALRARIAAEFEAADADDDVDAMAQLADHMDTVRNATPAADPAPATPDPVKVEEPPAKTEPEPAEPPAAEPPAAEPPPTGPVAEATPAEPVADTSGGAEPTASPSPESTPVQEALPVAASATIQVPEGAEPVVASAKPVVMAGADIPGYTAGFVFDNSQQFADAYTKRLNTLLNLRGNGGGEQIVIASVRAPEVDSSRVLDMGDWKSNMEKIEAVTNPDAFVHPTESITASGGCCAPLVTRYELWDNGGVTARPVRDALAGFRADRGGIRFYAGPELADVQGALGFWTCADDAAADAGNPSTWKVCARINCPPEQTAELQAITMCLTFGVLQTRIFPELAVANNKLAMVAQARLADSALLAQIKAGSLAIADSGTPLGAVRDLMDSISRAVYYYRDRYRLDKNVKLRAILPQWLPLVLRGDIIKGPFDGHEPSQFFGLSEDEIASFFSNLGVNPTWALDSATPNVRGGGVLPAATTALPAWPTSVEWALFPEGTWLFLDGGNLDLGVVRDSTLVRVNDYMQFSETFEATANIGCESMWITSTIDVTGKAQGPIAG